MMNTLSPLARGALWLAALAVPAPALAQTNACLTPREGEAVLLYLAPDLLAQATRTCAPVLPASAYLRRNADLGRRYAGASADAWPAARGGIAKIAGPDVAPLLDSAFAAAAVSSLVAPLVAQEITAGDCPQIDRILSLVAPLPPQNVAGIAVAFLQLANDRDRRAGRRSPLPICTK
ncbi:hypothetical protein COC42_01030 [Sphingomonas spermidinifaciens]|uniref:Uncharacterized protein n=2 Tax=Sphingomonas spermidinifaciens TaxID=1141889 RepID=A0A2A4B1H5_9SPHN|nr:hypothetical protein COC42_01030 [Sphingomonas spermidinifaciens]